MKKNYSQDEVIMFALFAIGEANNLSAMMECDVVSACRDIGKHPEETSAIVGWAILSLGACSDDVFKEFAKVRGPEFEGVREELIKMGKLNPDGSFRESKSADRDPPEKE